MNRLALIIVLVVMLFSFMVAASGEQTVRIQSAEEISTRNSYSSSLVISAKIDDGPWSKKQALYPLKGQSVKLRIPTKSYDKIRWYLIFADLTKYYKNANHPWEPNAYAWTGFEKITYYRMELTRFANETEIAPFFGPPLFEPVRALLAKHGRPEWALAYYHDDVGTFWFQVEAEKGYKKYRSPGMEDANNRGLTKKVMRVSVRQEAGYLGYLSSLYNVPGVFGSTLSQSLNYVGADCADILMTARAKWKKLPLRNNFNVSMLVDRFRHLSTVTLKGGMPDKEIKWGTTIRPGDFIAVRYSPSGKKFHHIGALYRDGNGNGVLDGEDIVMHAGPDPLHLSALNEGVFDGHVVLLRH
jgi:hypothetical protein